MQLLSVPRRPQSPKPAGRGAAQLPASHRHTQTVALQSPKSRHSSPNWGSTLPPVRSYLQATKQRLASITRNSKKKAKKWINEIKRFSYKILQFLNVNFLSSSLKQHVYTSKLLFICIHFLSVSMHIDVWNEWPSKVWSNLGWQRQDNFSSFFFDFHLLSSVNTHRAFTYKPQVR